MRVLQVIHGYPPQYNAGSEVYTQTLAHGLAARHEVHVFTREENPFAPDYAVRRAVDADDPRVALHLVNMPRSRDRYRHAGVDQRFAELLDQLRPEVVHVGHLNHLSTSLLVEAAAGSAGLEEAVARSVRDITKLRSEVARTPLWPPSLTGDDALRLVAGLLLYATLIWLHPALIGVSPLP